MPVAKKLRAFLDEHRVRYWVLKHHEEFTSQQIAQALHIPGQELAKVVIVKAGGELIMAVLPASLLVDLEAFARAAGVEQAELATEEEFKGSFPDCEVGAMPPFGNLYDMKVLVDKNLTEDEEIVFEAGNHKEAIKIAYSDFAELARPIVAEYAAT